jgi:hypothetical protein
MQYVCAVGYDGPLCATSATGYSLFGAVSQPCWPEWAADLLILLIAILVLTVAVYLALKHAPGARSPAAIAFRQVLGYVQILSVVSSFRVQSGLRSLLGWTDAVNASLVSFGPLGCTALGQSSFLGRFLLTLALPLMIALLVAGISLGVARFCRSQPVSAAEESAEQRHHWLGVSATPKSDSKGSATPQSLGDDVDVFSVNPLQHAVRRSAVGLLASQPQPCTGDAAPAAKPGATSVATQVGVKQRLLSVLLLLTSLFYMPLLSASLRALDCYDRPVDGAFYLRADMRVQCYTGQHLTARAVAISVIVLLTAALPLTLVLLLARFRGRSGAAAVKALSDKEGHAASTPALPAHSIAAHSWLQALRPLFDGYDVQRGLLWWEAVIFVRKALLAIIGTLVSDARTAIALFVMILLAADVLQSSFQPYEDPRFNRHETAALRGALLIAVLALLLSQPPANELHFAPSAADICALTALVALAMGVLLLLLWSWLHTARGQTRALCVRARQQLQRVRGSASRRLRCVDGSAREETSPAAELTAPVVALPRGVRMVRLSEALDAGQPFRPDGSAAETLQPLAPSMGQSRAQAHNRRSFAITAPAGPLTGDAVGRRTAAAAVQVRRVVRLKPYE